MPIHLNQFNSKILNINKAEKAQKLILNKIKALILPKVKYIFGYENLNKLK